MEKQNKVAVNLVQDFTDSEKRQARENIGIDIVPVPQVQSDWAQADNTKVDFIKNKPNGMVVDPLYVHTDNNFTNADKTKLDGLVMPVNADWDAGSGLAEILHKPSIPSKTSDLTNDSGYITAADIPAQKNADWDATSGVQEILHKPAIPSKTSQLTNDSGFITAADIPAQQNADWNATSGVQEILHKPTIPSKTSQLTNDSGYITAAAIPAQQNSDWNATSGVQEILHKPTIPSNTSQLTNDSGFITIADVPAQVNSDWSASSGVAMILNKPETKFWYFDLNGVESTTWATIGPVSVGDTVHLPIQWDDQGTLGREQVHTNFTQGDPEAFPISTGSSWIVLKKGLWRYTLYVDLEPTTLGTGIAPMSLWMRVMREGVANYITVRRIDMPVNNAVQSTYTRTISGLYYSDIDPTYSGGEIATYRSIHFDFDINGACDAVYRFRQNAIMLERLGV